MNYLESFRHDKIRRGDLVMPIFDSFLRYHKGIGLVLSRNETSSGEITYWIYWSSMKKKTIWVETEVYKFLRKV